MERWGVPPTNLHECQNKGLTKFAFRKWLILKDAISVVLRWARAEEQTQKQKREQAPAL
jgi:hypothetical protein